MTARSISRSVAISFSRSIVGRLIPWTPTTLFAGGQQGLWLEPSFQTSHTDAAGTTLVTTDGDPIGNEDDRSPNDNDAAQGIASNRPLFRTSSNRKQFDGSSDFLRVDTGQETVQPVFHAIAFRLRSTGGTQSIFNGVNDGGGGGTNVQYLAEVSGNFQVSAGVALNVAAVDTNTHVLTVLFDGVNSFVRMDGVQVASGDTGSNAWRGTTLGASRVNGSFGAVDIYAYLAREGAPSLGEIEMLEGRFANLAGS